jgi:hypothetical protein
VLNAGSETEFRRIHGGEKEERRNDALEVFDHFASQGWPVWL